MRQTRILMGMPVIVEVVDASVYQALLERVFDYFGYIDRKFSTYKEDSEIARINKHELLLEDASEDMKTVFFLAQETCRETDGYFQIEHNGRYDPSGIVKGWAIQQAAKILERAGCSSYYVDAGGDIEVRGLNPEGKDWRVGIQNPFNPQEIIKIVHLRDAGIATSGTYVRGQHIYNPMGDEKPIRGIVSLTVIGPNVYEADRFATAAFAMGPKGIRFIEELDGFEGYMIDEQGIATYTSGFERYIGHAENNR